jgi:hypothetical protein
VCFVLPLSLYSFNSFIIKHQVRPQGQNVYLQTRSPLWLSQAKTSGVQDDYTNDKQKQEVIVAKKNLNKPRFIVDNPSEHVDYDNSCFGYFA